MLTVSRRINERVIVDGKIAFEVTGIRNGMATVKLTGSAGELIDVRENAVAYVDDGVEQKLVVGESIQFGSKAPQNEFQCRVFLSRVERDSVRVTFDAPREIPVFREELLAKKQAA